MFLNLQKCQSIRKLHIIYFYIHIALVLYKGNCRYIRITKYLPMKTKQNKIRRTLLKDFKISKVDESDIQIVEEFTH
jgi:hypothetical protein